MADKTMKKLPVRKTPAAADVRRYSVLLALLIIAQPFLDNYYLYTDAVAAYTFGFTMPPILVLIVVYAAALFWFCKFRGGRTGKILAAYIAVCAVYFVLHHLNCVDFTSYVEGDFNYSVINEAYYVARLIAPMLLIYLTYEADFDGADYLNASCIMGAVCGVALLATNLLGIGLCSYTNEAAYGSMLNWGEIMTTEELLPKFYATKAFFSYANQASVVLTGLFPLMCYKVVRSPKWYNIANIIVLTAAMFTLGTMTAAIGVILETIVLVLVVIVYIIYNRKRLRRFKKNIVAMAVTGAVIIGIIACLAPVSPAIRNMGVKEANDLGNKMEHFDLDMSGAEMTDELYEQYCIFVRYNYEAAGIAWRYVHVYYPYEADPAFWVAMIRNYTVGDNQNYRSLETRVNQRITQIDGSPYNSLLGISATRQVNIVKIERDILSQYYSMGILGVILFFGAYFAVILVAAVSILRQMIKGRKFPLFEVILAMSFCVMLVMGYYCGNSLDMTFLSTYMGVTAGVMLLTAKAALPEEAGRIRKGLYYLFKIGPKKTAALVAEKRADDAHSARLRKAALDMYPEQAEKIKKALSGKTVIVYTPTVEWHYLRQRCHQMASNLAAREGYAVIFLSSQTHCDNERGITEVEPNLYLINAALAARLDELCSDARCVVSSVYNITSGVDILDSYRSDKLVYEYVDDLRFIVSGASNFEAYAKKHEALLRRADLSVATAGKLYDEIEPIAKNAVLLPNAADCDFFSKPAEPNADLSDKLRGYACVLEYYGALASWFDYRAVADCAKARPDWAWVLIGTVIGSDMEKSGVLNLPNVIHIPAVPYEKLPEYIACADVMTIPFVINETTLATSPVKLFEYMAAGKPVLTSDMPECRRYESVCRYEAEGEIPALTQALLAKRDDADFKALLQKEASENTWRARADEIVRRLGL